MATSIKATGKAIRFDCIDTFKGSPRESDGGFHEKLVSRMEKTLLESFEDNLSECGLREYVTPVKIDSLNGADLYEDNSLDLIMIDADHRRGAVCGDVAAWLPKLRYGGVLCGHDANNENVIAGVRDCDLEPKIEGMMWSWRKRYPINVNRCADNNLGSGILRFALTGSGEISTWFGEKMAAWALEELPRYFVHDEGGIGFHSCQIPPFTGKNADNYVVRRDDLTLCLCDGHSFETKTRLIRRSTESDKPCLPAFPHRGWEFNDPRFNIDLIDWRQTPAVGFCGVTARPEMRRQTVVHLSGLAPVEPRIIHRDKFMGSELPFHVARAQYRNTIVNCGYQLCVRGVGNFCYRLYETLALGRVPVIITPRALPLKESLPWENMAVMVEFDQLGTMAHKILAFNKHMKSDWEKVQRTNRQIWIDYLSPVGWWREWGRSQ